MLSYQGREIDPTPPWRRATLEELVLEHAGVEVELVDGHRRASRRVAASPRRSIRALVRAGQAHLGDLREDHGGRAVGADLRL